MIKSIDISIHPSIDQICIHSLSFLHVLSVYEHRSCTQMLDTSRNEEGELAK